MNRFMAVLNDENQKSKGHTVLYLPNENLIGEVSLLITNKELMQRLEAIVIHWTRQIKDVLHTNQGETQGQSIELPSQGTYFPLTHSSFLHSPHTSIFLLKVLVTTLLYV